MVVKEYLFFPFGVHLNTLFTLSESLRLSQRCNHKRSLCAFSKLSPKSSTRIDGPIVKSLLTRCSSVADKEEQRSQAETDRTEDVTGVTVLKKY